MDICRCDFQEMKLHCFPSMYVFAHFTQNTPYLPQKNNLKHFPVFFPAFSF